MKSIGELLNWGVLQLQRATDKRNASEISEAKSEVLILLAYALKCDRVKLLTWPEKLPDSPEMQSGYETLIQRRVAGEPIAMIVGKKAFWKWDFSVTTDTLIPRPETELLIEQVLAHLPATPLTVVDVGTGSGIIACTLAKERPLWQIIATDSSEAALKVAQTNAERLHLLNNDVNLCNIKFHLMHWCEGLAPQSVDVVVSNPPYIAENDPHLFEGDVRFEPKSALVSGPTGLEAYEILILMAKVVLKPGGLLAFEHGFEQADAVQALMREQGFKDIQTFNDLAHHPRVTLGFR